MPLSMRAHTFTAIFAALLSGLLIASGFPGDNFPTLSQGWLLPFAFVPLFLALETIPAPGVRTAYGKTRGEYQIHKGTFAKAFFFAWLAGVTLAAFAFFWFTKPAILFGKLPSYVAFPGFGIYCLFSGLFLPTVLLPFLISAVRRAKKQRPFPLLPMVLVSVFLEMTVPRLFYWTFGSLMHSVESVNQWASLFGFASTSGLILLSNSFIARTLVDGPRSAPRLILKALVFCTAWGVVIGYGKLRVSNFEKLEPTLPKTRVGYIQPNFTFSELASNPYRPADAQTMSLENLLRMSTELVEENVGRKIDLIVWPESVVPFSFVRSKSQMQQVKDFSALHDIPILVQATEMDDDEIERLGYQRATLYSASFLIRPDGSKSDSFRKWVPIPFGETVPLESSFPALGEFVRDNIGNTSKVGLGTSYEALSFTPELKVAPLICFDSIYPELPRLQASKGGADIFVNQANFVWMDLSNAGAEFKELDRFRAIENARPLLLVSNTGPSVAFDPLGRELFPTTALMSQAKGTVDLPIWKEETLYSKWGDVPHLAAGIANICYLIWFARRRRTS